MAVNIVLISTYELGRQPFGLASPAAWLRKRGHSVVALDLARQSLDESAIGEAGLIAIYLPMHTATRLAAQLIPVLRKQNPSAHLCCYGLYAPMNVEYLRALGVSTILGGEFEEGLVQLAGRMAADGKQASAQPAESLISMARLQFEVPDRSGMPAMEKYARLIVPGDGYRIVGSTEASRGCKHLCRHCPIVPVYKGVFRIVSRDVVLEDIRRQVTAGAQHITFGDPDFFNGIRHAMELAEAFHREFPAVTYDVTIKIEHLLKYEGHLPALRDTGCLFVISAVESVDDAVLGFLDKGHTREDFLRVVKTFSELGMTLHPTFVPFTPWTTAWYSLAHPGRLANAGIRGGVSPGWAVRSAVAGVLLEKRRPAPGRSQRNRPGDRRRGGAAKRIAACYIRTHLEGSTRRSQLARSTDQPAAAIPGWRPVSHRTLVLLCRANPRPVGLHRRPETEAAGKKCGRKRRWLCLIPARKRGSLDFVGPAFRGGPLFVNNLDYQ